MPIPVMKIGWRFTCSPGFSNSVFVKLGTRATMPSLFVRVYAPMSWW